MHIPLIYIIEQGIPSGKVTAHPWILQHGQAGRKQQQTGKKNAQHCFQEKQQKIMRVIMPLFIGWISLSFPSGLVIYWFLSNVFQLAQQMIMFRNKGKGAKA